MYNANVFIDFLKTPPLAEVLEQLGQVNNFLTSMNIIWSNMAAIILGLVQGLTAGQALVDNLNPQNGVNLRSNIKSMEHVSALMSILTAMELFHLI